MPRITFVLRLALLLAGGLLAACSTPSPVTAPPAGTPPDSKAALPEVAVAQKLRVVAVGDMMLGTDFPINRLPDEGDPGLLDAMQPVLQRADVTFGNLEGTLMDGGEPVKTCQRRDRCYLFRSPSRFAVQLQQAGFDVLSLANNHARDFGEKGRSASMQALDALAIHHSGRRGDVASWQVKGRRLALVAFAPFKNSHDMINLTSARDRVASLAQDHDIVIVSMHAGAEGAEAAHVPFKTEFYYGENRGDVVAFAHAVIDAGADLVIGHGPHVPRALELYRGRLVAYSLGNFCTYYGISVSGNKGLAPVLEVDVDGEGQFLDGRIISARQVRPRGPLPDTSQAAAHRIKSLTESDFPDTLLRISNNGKIQRRQANKSALAGE